MIVRVNTRLLLLYKRNKRDRFSLILEIFVTMYSRGRKSWEYTGWPVSTATVALKMILFEKMNKQFAVKFYQLRNVEIFLVFEIEIFKSKI